MTDPGSVPTELAERVLSALSDAVVVLDRQGCVITWSGGAERVFGRPAEDALG
jgi:PAS domain-containing protein